MNKVPIIRSSIFSEDSKSLRLAHEFLAHYPHSSAVERVLTPASMPHLTAEVYRAMGKPESELIRRATAKNSDGAMSSLTQHDLIPPFRG